MFAERFDIDSLSTLVKAGDSLGIFPLPEDHTAWTELPDKIRHDILEQAKNYRGVRWPTLPATLYMEYKRDGNRDHFQTEYFERRRALTSLLLAECLENKCEYLDDIINVLWAICEESSWVIPAHNRAGDTMPDPWHNYIDLFSAETGASLAWTLYFIKPRLQAVSPLMVQRIEDELRKRIMEPYMAHDDFFWMGFTPDSTPNNWNPWCNSNCLTVFLIQEKDPDKRAAAVHKILRSLDAFAKGYEADGGCDEGPGYWSHAGCSLFDCLYLLKHASNGEIDFFTESKVREMGRFIYRVFISGDYFVNFSDAPARSHLGPGRVYAFGKSIEDPKLMQLAGHIFHNLPVSKNANRAYVLPALLNVFSYAELQATSGQPPYVRDSWLESIQLMTAREEADTDAGFFLSAKGGHNDVSHNHNDVGNFIVYYDGKPVIIDVGVEEYTAKTFSDRRYEIWTMQSGYHNLPVIDGLDQLPGGKYQATGIVRKADYEQAELSMDIANAWGEAAGIEKWRRSCRLVRKPYAYIEIIDDFRLNHASSDISLNLMCRNKPEIRQPGIICLISNTNCEIQLIYDAEKLEPAAEEIPIENPKLQNAWGEKIYRLRMISRIHTSEDIYTMRIVKA
ncbi:MAG: heparinase II/III family protein [Candidatus Sumerlaeia bacterium]